MNPFAALLARLQGSQSVEAAPEEQSPEVKAYNQMLNIRNKFPQLLGTLKDKQAMSEEGGPSLEMQQQLSDDDVRKTAVNERLKNMLSNVPRR